MTDPFGIDQTPSGLLIVTCQTSRCVYSVDPLNGVVLRLAGSVSGVRESSDGDPFTEAKFELLFGVTVIESEKCIAICDKNLVRKMPLPDHFFVPFTPASDTDL